ncbi:MAG: MFS transporter [Candidatus Zixiibacteriota bacterium]
MTKLRSVWRKDVIAWSLYDFANTIYSMNIVSLYLKRYIVEDLHYSDHYFDIAFAVSMVIAAALLPALGALSDHSAKKKLFLLLFTVTCCLSVGAMSVAATGPILGLIVLFVIANFSYEGGMPFYNALLYSVAEGKQARFVSGVGVAFGYIGSIIGMILVLPFVTGSLFSVEIPYVDGSGKAGAFLPTAFLFLVFALPLYFWVRERKGHQPQRVPIATAYREVWDGLRNTRQYPGVLRFLIADYFVEDAVATVILNIGLYCSVVLGLAESQISLFLIISTISAVIGSFVIGKIAERWSLKKLLVVIFTGWVVALLMFVLVDNMAVIWLLGSMVGIFLGGLWTTTRPMLAELVSHDQLGRFFGIFSLSGRAAAIVGPLVWTGMVYLFHPERALGSRVAEFLHLTSTDAAKLPYKMGVLSLAAMVLIGLFIFRKVPHTQKLSHG